MLYTVPLIEKLLYNYNLLEMGELPFDDVDWGTVIQGRSYHAPYELAAILKADIDRTIRHLRMIAKFVITNKCINGRDTTWCAYLLQREDVLKIEQSAILAMAHYLNH